MLILILILCLILSYLHNEDTNKSYTSEDLGKIGEDKVKKIIPGNIEGKQYVIHDLLIQDEYGNKSQIDHIVINKYGIHVIETKNWSGNIIGDRDSMYWVETFNNSNKSYNLYNPIKQNETHINRLRNNIGYVPIHSIVCLTNPNIRLNNTFNEVCVITELNNKLKIGYMDYSEKKIKYLYNTIKSLNIR